MIIQEAKKQSDDSEELPLGDDNDNTDDTEKIETYSNIKSKQFAKLFIFNLLSSFLSSLMIILPLYLSQYFGGCLDVNNLKYVDPDCLPDFIAYARYIAIIVPINIAIQFLFSAFIGRLTDSFGRKLFLIIPTFLSVMPHLMMCFYFNIWIYTILSILAGFISTESVKTMVADIINPEQRINAFAAFSVAAAIGSLLGLITANIISVTYGTHTVFYVSSAGYILLLIYILVVMNETIDINKNRRPWNKIEIRNPLRPIFIARKNKLILWICMIAVSMGITVSVLGNFVSFLGAEMKLNDEKMTFILTVLLGIMAISTVLSNAILLPLLQSKINDINILIFSLIMFIIALIFYGSISFVSENLDIPFACIASVFGGIAGIYPAVENGILSKAVHKEYQGVAFGVKGAYFQIALIFAFFISGFIYVELDKNSMRYFIFVFGIFFVMIAIILTIFPLKKQLNKQYSSNEKIQLLSTKNIFEKVEQRDIETADVKQRDIEIL